MRSITFTVGVEHINDFCGLVASDSRLCCSGRHVEMSRSPSVGLLQHMKPPKHFSHWPLQRVQLRHAILIAWLQVVGSIKAGLTVQQQFESFLEAGHDCRNHGVNGRLRRVLKAQLQK